ncbi:hypothetical protein H0H92_004371 [Tricholoma furcatifolium]|nr:hypothetical protein H0H92_004371 [Tricholoma furcatifolium]
MPPSQFVLERADELPWAIYDEESDVDRCMACSWEVVEGVCSKCETEHRLAEARTEFMIGRRTRLTILLQDDELVDSLLTEDYDSDREQAPRGDTPLLLITQAGAPLPGYTEEEYDALLQRGATRLMIDTFELEFSNEHGIFAWADHDLYAEFAGPQMKKGDLWKIQLGRRFVLDDDDYDGSWFIEGLLEEAIMYPSPCSRNWETVEEMPGIFG